MDLGLAGKVVLITGASGGIGRALADGFAAEGCKLLLTGNSQFAAMEKYVGEQTWRKDALCAKADTTKPGQIEAACAAAVKKFGRIDVCVANAGKWPMENLRLDEIGENRLRSTLEANLMGSIWTARAFMKTLAATGPRKDEHGASLTFIGSTAGRFGERMHVDYSIGKTGLYGLVRSLKNEVVLIDPYARVNMVEPGWTITHMAREALNQPGAIQRILRTMPLRQLGRAVDIARSVMFLSSPLAARHISGEVLTVAGGMEGRALWTDDQVDVDAVKKRLKRE